jgi:hypothetical protein
LLATSLACSKYIYIPPSSFTYDGPTSDGISHRSLTRADFQAHKPIAPPARGTIIAQTAVACLADTFSIVPVADGGAGAMWRTSFDRLRIRAVMYPKASWWDPKLTSQGDVQRMLEHEQGHFDIAELVARQYNVRFQSIHVIAPSPHKSKVSARERYNQEAIGMQRLLTEWNAMYDRETKNGSDPREQQRWIARLRKDLAETSTLASRTGRLPTTSGAR